MTLIQLLLDLRDVPIGRLHYDELVLREGLYTLPIYGGLGNSRQLLEGALVRLNEVRDGVGVYLEARDASSGPPKLVEERASEAEHGEMEAEWTVLQFVATSGSTRALNQY